MKKFFPNILIIFLLVTAFFVFTEEAKGQASSSGPSNTSSTAATVTDDTLGFCTRITYGASGLISNKTETPDVKKRDCPTITHTGSQGGTDQAWIAYSSANPVGSSINGTPDDTSPLEKFVNKACSLSLNGITQGCFLYIAYYIFYTIPAWLLWLAATLFNALVSIGLSTNLYTESTFISTAWAVVRDLSNIFFILILLYVAVETILGMGHNTKKTIAQVLMMALLINFSMFFTKIVIDTSNVVALVFYNRMDVSTKIDGTQRPYQEGSSNPGEKDISGGLMKAFDPTQLISDKFFNAAQTTVVNGRVVSFDEIPFGIVLGVTLLAGAIMSVAAYAFLISGMAFLGRLIELWALIIFSPFAFMSSTVHKLAGTEYIGWNQWSSRLLKVSFMAPIFMFFMYLIFMLVQSNIFGTFLSQTQSKAQILLSVVIPALVIIKLLLKATSMAKESAGEAGEFVMGAAKGIAGLAVGGAALGAGAVAVGGRYGASKLAGLSRSEDAIKYGETYRKAQVEFSHELDEWEKTGKKQGKPKPTWQEHWELEVATNPNQALRDADWKTRLGGRINAAQIKKQDVSHAMHEWDDLKKKVGAEGVSNDNLSGAQTTAMETSFKESNRSKVEGFVARGHDDKGKEIKVTATLANGTKVDVVGSAGFERVMRPDVIERVKAAGVDADFKKDALGRRTGELSDQGQRKVESILSEEYTRVKKDKAETLLKEKYDHLKSETKETVTTTEKAAAASVSGSYDARNLSALKTNKMDGGKLTAGIAFISAVAAGVRLGLKKTTGGYDGGVSKRDVVADLKDILGESLKNLGKNMKIKVDLGGGGGHGGGDHGGGGHDDHGHGGGGHH